jgi:hypothetical protein
VANLGLPACCDFAAISRILSICCILPRTSNEGISKLELVSRLGSVSILVVGLAPSEEQAYGVRARWLNLPVLKNRSSCWATRAPNSLGIMYVPGPGVSKQQVTVTDIYVFAC